MHYHLLTGATGLLGSYLVREFLRSGRRLAVVVRASQRQSARQRIENLTSRWEKEVGYALPRPVVLEGDISKPDLGLERRWVDWVSRHCTSVLHNAASLTFQPDERSGEPWRSNLEGTRNVLELCRRAGIRQFHHVSTAYVCGLREGRILESEVDVGQTLGNAYEQSKLEAEKMVRSAAYLDGPTIYRPSIIVGDSQTGYTATFHAFYVPLQIAHSISGKIDPSLINGQPMLELLGLSGRERKSLVPVDWVGAMIAHLHGRPECHGQTYHLTPPQAVPVSLICEVVEEVLRSGGGTGSRETAVDLSGFERTFRDAMEVYRSYWRDDPEFDTTNSRAAAPNLPCPELDRTVLARLAAFAVRTNFGWPRPPAAVVEFDVPGHLAPWLETALPREVPGSQWLGLQVNGRGGGQWKLLVRGNQVLAAEPGLSAACTSIYYLNSKTFQQLVTRKQAVSEAINTGRVLIEGGAAAMDRLEAILRTLAVGDRRDAA